MKRTKNIRTTKKKKSSKRGLYITLIGIVVLFVCLFLLVLSFGNRQSQRTFAAPSADLLTDRPNLSFTSGAHTSQYHLYAAGLDYSKPVGMLFFADGTGESGFSKPTSSYQMGGPNGLIAVAKKHNMVLLYPASPNRTCKCWHQGDRAGYMQWAEALVTSVEAQYQIDKRRVAAGGYSSGATLLSLDWIPSGAAQRTMEDGVVVFLSLGGSGRTSSVSPAFKANVHLNWNIGDGDEFFEDAKEGHASYTSQGFQTSIDIIPGMGHNRPSDFGKVMDAQITKHVPPATGAAPSTAAPSGSVPAPTSVSPTYFCGGSNVCIPSGSPSVAPPSAVPTAAPTIASTIAPTIVQVTPGNGGGVSPTEYPNNPNPTPIAGGGGGGGGNNGGFIGMIIGFLMLLLQMFMSMFG